MATPNTLTIAHVAAMSHERTNTNSAFYPFRGGMTHLVHTRGSRNVGTWAPTLWAKMVDLAN